MDIGNRVVITIFEDRFQTVKLIYKKYRNCIFHWYLIIRNQKLSFCTGSNNW